MDAVFSGSVLHNMGGKVLQVLQAWRVSRKEVCMVGLMFMKLKEGHLAWVPAQSASTYCWTYGPVLEDLGDTVADHLGLSRHHSLQEALESDALGV